MLGMAGEVMAGGAGTVDMPESSGRLVFDPLGGVGLPVGWEMTGSDRDNGALDL